MDFMDFSRRLYTYRWASEGVDMYDQSSSAKVPEHQTYVLV